MPSPHSEPAIFVVAPHAPTRHLVGAELRGRYSIDYDVVEWASPGKARTERDDRPAHSAAGAGAIGIQRIHQCQSERRAPG